MSQYRTKGHSLNIAAKGARKKKKEIAKRREAVVKALLAMRVELVGEQRKLRTLDTKLGAKWTKVKLATKAFNVLFPPNTLWSDHSIENAFPTSGNDAAESLQDQIDDIDSNIEQVKKHWNAEENPLMR